MKIRSNVWQLVVGALAFGCFAGWLGGCASAPIPRGPSEYLLSADRSTNALLIKLKAALEANKYQIRKLDPEVGLLVTEPRVFGFRDQGKKVLARQTLQLRQEGGSLKVRILYECDYGGEGIDYESCYASDPPTQAKISRVEEALLAEIKPLLMKHSGQ